MFRKRSFFRVVSVFVSAVFIFSFVISCGGGGSSSLPQLNFSSGNQAASASFGAAAAVELADAMNMVASGMVDSSAAQAGYAPNKGKTINTSAIASLDPRLKMVVDKMAGQMQTIGRKNTKVRSKANMKTTVVPAGGTCSAGGSYSVNGTDNSDEPDRTYDEATVTITYANCRDSVDFTEISGTLQLYSKVTPSAPAVPTSVIRNVTITNTTFKQYYDETFAGLPETGVINGTFNSTNNVTSGSDYANGSFVFNDGMGEASFFFDGLTNNWSTSTSAEATTDIASMNGKFGISYTDGMNTASLTISLTNLEYKERMYAADYSVDRWLNGTLGIVWDPLVCASGTITFTTADATPLHYNNIFDTCPVSGTLQVNNATIVYGSSIIVTLNGVEYPYTDCTEMEMSGNGICL